MRYNQIEGLTENQANITAKRVRTLLRTEENVRIPTNKVRSILSLALGMKENSINTPSLRKNHDNGTPRRWNIQWQWPNGNQHQTSAMLKDDEAKKLINNLKKELGVINVNVTLDNGTDHKSLKSLNQEINS